MFFYGTPRFTEAELAFAAGVALADGVRPCGCDSTVYKRWQVGLRRVRNDRGGDLLSSDSLCRICVGTFWLSAFGCRPKSLYTRVRQSLYTVSTRRQLGPQIKPVILDKGPSRFYTYFSGLI